jgi:hypothetical protein
MSKSHRDPARERFWRDAIADQQASGRTVRDFCRDRRLTETSFHHWRRELRERDAAARTGPVPPPVAPRPATPAFVPVTVVPTPISPSIAVEVRCPSGHVVTLTGADLTLRELFAALATAPAEGPSC